MPIPMSSEERELRRRLGEAVRTTRASLNRCPFADELDRLDEAEVAATAALVDEANRSLVDALACTDAIDQLRGASEDAASLVATSRTALGVVREVLTVLAAAVDCRRAA